MAHAAAEAEEDTPLGAGINNSNSNSLADKGNRKHAQTGTQVRRRLAFCLFLNTVGVAIIMQVYPKVILEYFHNDDGKASKFNGWLTFASSALQLIAIPTLSSMSDTVGRKVVLGGSLALPGLTVLALALTPDSIVAVVTCQIVSGICSTTLPISQAIIIDVSSWEDAGEVTHGLGLLGAMFGLAIGIGPIVGGSLSELHKSVACLLCTGMSLLSLLSLRFYGWDETAPGRRLHDRTSEVTGRRERCEKCRSWQFVNPFSILKVLLDSRLLTQLSLCLLLFGLALNAYTVYYNYFDYRYRWTALEISLFISTLGVLLAFTSGVGIRLLIPKRLSEAQGVLVGMLMQFTSATLYGLAPRGWMLYPILLVTLVEYVTVPCIQALMAKLVQDNQQGSLQGAVMSLKILAEGIAALAYGQVFSFGVSNTIKKALGIRVPGLPFFLSAFCSLCAMMVAWCALGRFWSTTEPLAFKASGTLDSVEEAMDHTSSCTTEIGDSARTVDDTASNVNQENGAMSEMLEALLSGATRDEA